MREKKAQEKVNKTQSESYSDEAYNLPSTFSLFHLPASVFNVIPSV